MRILHIAPTDVRRSGIATYARHYRAALQQSGHVVIDLVEQLRARSRTFDESSLSAAIACSRGLSQDALMRDVDLIHLEVGTELVPEFFAGRELARATGLPLVATVHDAPYTVKNLQPYINLAHSGSFPARALRKVLNRTIGRGYEHDVIDRSSAVFVLNQRAQGFLQRRFPKVPVRVLRHIAPVEHLENRVDWWSGPRPLRLLFVGFVAARKGLHVLISALGTIQEDSRYRGRFSLTVCGGMVKSQRDNPYLDTLKRNVVENGLEDIVRFAGFVSDEDLLKELTRSDVMVLPYLPSKEISTSGPLIQAMSYSLVPVVTTARSMSEIVRDGQNGQVVPPDDPAALARVLKDLSDSPSLLRRLGLSARETIQREYSWSAIAKEATTVYETIAVGPRR
jgi:polysaccharide biosynthesis protein PslF